MIFGTCVHEAIKLYYDNIRDNPSDDQISSVFKDAIQELCGPINAPVSEITKITNNFTHFEVERKKRSKKYKPVLVEKKISNDLFVTIPDVFYEDIGLCVNWKTGYTDKLYTDHLRQGAIESIVLRDQGYVVKSHAFYMLCTGILLTTPKVTDAWIISQRESMINCVKTGLIQKKDGYHCDYCPYIIRCRMQGVKLWSRYL